jgi:tRNA(Arg) A34 adenosine deaminase TadA
MADDRNKALRQPGNSIALPRRWLLSTLGVAAVLAPSLRATARTPMPQAVEEIIQPDRASDTAFIRRAFEMRRIATDHGDQAYGAAVVRGGRIIGQSWSRVILDQDPTGHAEISAIRDASRRLQDRSLSGAVLYSSSRPCPMCEAAAYWAGIDEMIHGDTATRAGSPRLCR